MLYHLMEPSLPGTAASPQLDWNPYTVGRGSPQLILWL